MKDRCWIAASSCACTSAAPRLSRVRFWSALQAVQGGETSSRYRLSSSHRRSVLSCVAAKDRSHGRPFSSSVVRSIEKPGVHPSLDAVAAVRGGEYISATSTLDLSKVRL